MVSARARRQQVSYARNRGISEQRACALLSVSRSTLGYCSRMVAKDEPVRAAMQELSGQSHVSAIAVSGSSWSGVVCR